jgi:glycosyltransferase involved in cell wall biosynthesis
MSKKTIALIDWNWMGHHPTYFTEFASALAEIGYDVLPFCPDPEDFSKRLSIIENLKSQHLGKIFPAQTLTPSPLGRIRPGRFRPHHQAVKQFGGIGSRLRTWEKQFQKKINAVFFACIYDSQFRYLKYGSPFLGYPWAGLYLHARSFRMPGTPIPYTGGLPCPERIFTLKSCLGVALLDEWAENPMRDLIGEDKSVTIFPDFTDVILPASDGKNNSLAGKISNFSNGKKIISLLGHLQRTKGIVEFTNAAKAPESQNVFFFLGGELNWSEITSSEKESLKEDWENIQNVFCHFDRIKDEATLNQVIAISDIVFAAYRDFPNSSNILTKAAYFRKPIIVSDGYLMAERVRKFELGEVVPEGDQNAINDTLQKMLQPSYYAELEKRAKWDEYNQIHSSQQLLKSFKELFSNL